ncbi:hypothetical protein [Deinococcus sp. Leaf326]|jgi:hypothetical protein|uniref:hypothetical protein n=1 Tax=Deinococcus sp. Leaf326 TaxID=1736338 RepID=UPI0006FE5909|nr:hypothetical protein [Deinococcus sp. Leaf326]KQR35145.1 hypothetical protein ASF71_16320 [Deinococcus sp. Leaf326]
MTLFPTQNTWSELQDLLQELGPRDLYTIGDLENAGQFLFQHTYSRRYLQETARLYALVLGQTLESRARRNFNELLLTPAQFTGLLSLFREARATSFSITDLLTQWRQQEVRSPRDEPSAEGAGMTMAELGDNVNRLIIETMECKERASGAEDTAMILRKELTQVRTELAQVNAKFDELLSLLRR